MAPAPGGASMTRDEVVQLFDRWQMMSSRRDAAGLAATYSEDCSVSSPIFGELKGRAAVEDSNRKLYNVFPDWDLTMQELIIDGERVVQIFNVAATHVGEFMGLPGTGRKAKFQGVRIIGLENGLIKSEKRLYDFTSLLMQVGVLRGKPGH